jgi:pimeloyl-ACP methyl ester carboxylesterase
VVFPGLGMTNANPVGLQRWGELRLLAPLARAFTVYRVGRRIGLEPGTTMSELANDYAEALEDEFGGPVDVLGISTGGSIALQLAAQWPELVRRLVVAGSAYRLSEHGRRFERRIAELAAAGDRRGMSRMMAPDVADSRLGRRVAGGLLWLAGPLYFAIATHSVCAFQHHIDTTLTPPRTQYGATQGKAQTREQLIYAQFATSCKPLQRMNCHS